MTLISVQNLCKTYSSEGVETLKSVNFVIEKGEFVSIMGPSGSGKSTMMQILGMLDRPTDGVYLFEGKDITKFEDDELALIRNKKIGFVFQSFNLLPRTTVYENTELPLLYDNDHLELNNEEKINKALAAVGMSHRTQYLSNQLSGGQIQRVAIARALVNDPSLIMADEPTGNLDTKTGEIVLGTFQRLNKEHNRTIILITHEHDVAEHAERIIYIRDGEIISDSKEHKRRIINNS